MRETVVVSDSVEFEAVLSTIIKDWHLLPMRIVFGGLPFTFTSRKQANLCLALSEIMTAARAEEVFYLADSIAKETEVVKEHVRRLDKLVYETFER